MDVLKIFIAEYVSLCSPQTPITELLFGDDLQARMASIKAANKISQNTTSSSKFTTNMRRPFEVSKNRSAKGKSFTRNSHTNSKPFLWQCLGNNYCPYPPTEVASGQEKEQPVTEATKFLNISQVNASTVKMLASYFQSKVACFKAGRLQLFYDKWENITSDVEVLHMISGQKLEFSKQPYQLDIPCTL